MIAIYARISVIHSDRKEDSIQNQINCCRKWITANIEQKEGQKQVFHDDTSTIAIYDDYGFSGGNFNRPAFQRLLNDIRSGVIHTVVVKDLSRLGRDYLMTGYYLEKVFPLFQIRFIAITENYDSRQISSSYVYLMKNFFNEWYRRDIGRKVSMVKQEKKENHEFLGSRARYGYEIVYREEKRILKPNAAIVVRFAICFLSECQKSSNEITSWLNEQNIAPPSVFEKTHCLREKGEKKEALWNAATVRKIRKQGI